MNPWQAVFLGGAALLVLIEIVHGWRRGIMRQAVGLAGLALAYWVAVVGTPPLVPLLRPLGLPDFALTVATGLCLALFVFLGINAAGIVLFRKTKEQGLFLVRWICGGGGAALGIVWAAAIIWIAAIALRVLGTIAAAELAEQAAGEGVRAIRPGPWAAALAHGKSALEEGPTGAVLERIDPVPATAYETIERITRMLATPGGVERFLAYPATRELAAHPKIFALREDRTVAEKLARRDYLGLLRHPALVAAANDREVAALVKKFDLRGALDHALAEEPRRPKAKAAAPGAAAGPAAGPPAPAVPASGPGQPPRSIP